MKFLRVLLAALLFTIASGASASYQAAGPTFTYAKVSFAYSANVSPFSSCNELEVDFTGLFVYPIDIMVYGKIKCPAVGVEYPVFGAGRVTTWRTFNMQLQVSGWMIHCVNLPEATLSGPCTIYDVNNVARGTVYVLFR
jgi:hypothetical protein